MQLTADCRLDKKKSVCQNFQELLPSITVAIRNTALMMLTAVLFPQLRVQLSSAPCSCNACVDPVSMTLCGRINCTVRSYRTRYALLAVYECYCSNGAWTAVRTLTCIVAVEIAVATTALWCRFMVQTALKILAAVANWQNQIKYENSFFLNQQSTLWTSPFN